MRPQHRQLGPGMSGQCLINLLPAVQPPRVVTPLGRTGWAWWTARAGKGSDTISLCPSNDTALKRLRHVTQG